jgi:carbon-monoxide dehydrogenase small subunit
MPKTPLHFRHNGREVAIFVDGGMSLLSVLRDEVGDHSPK